MSGPSTAIQYSFATGIASPGIWNRRDWDRTDAAIADGANGTIGPTGGFHKRPGMRFVNGALHDDKPITQATFEFSKDQVYELEFGDYQMRFYFNRGLILNDNDTPYVLATPYSAGQAAAFTYAQERDAMFFAHWDMPLKKLTRYGHNNWVWSDVFTASGRLASPSTVTWYDNASNGHNGYEYTVTAYRMVSGTPQESIGYTSLASDPATVDSINEVPQNNITSCLAWVDKYKALYGSVAGFPAIPAVFDLRSVSTDQQAPLATVATGATGGLNQRIYNVMKLMYPSLVSAGYGYEPIPPNLRAWDWILWGDSGSAVYNTTYLVTNTSNNQNGVDSSIDDQWEGYSNGPFSTWVMLKAAMDLINNNQVSSGGLTKNAIYNNIRNFVTTYNNANSQKILNHIRWSNVAGAAGYYVYRRPMEGQDRKFYRVATVTGAVHWLDADVSETDVGLQTPITGQNDFNSPDKYPALVTFFQQRLVLGCTKEKPTTIFGSRTGIYTDFTINASDDSSGYEFKMASKQSNPLEAILPLYTLVILTSGGDFISTVSGAMNASNVNFNQKSYNGASSVDPIIVGDTGIYVPLNQQTIRSMTYAYDKDGFRQDNILFQAQHLTKDKKVVGLAYQRDPINLIWALLNDGTLLSCTYIPEQSFLAWTRHETTGAVKSINVVPTSEGNDELWLVVERQLGDGTRKQYLEVLEDMRPYGGTPTAETAFYVDSGLSGVFDEPLTEIGGLEHLEGCEVAILADFSVRERQKVSGGTVTLNRPAKAVHIGLPYGSLLKTLDFELLNQGTLRDTRRKVNQCAVEVQDTRDLAYSLNEGQQTDFIVHKADKFGIPQLVNGDIKLSSTAGITRGAHMTLTSDSPLPSSVLSIVAEIEHGDSWK